MTTAAYGIENTQPFYPALDGTPLSFGSVWFGVAGQNPVTSPVSIYSDAAATQPIAQPVAISNGRTVDANGNPINIYVAGDFSRLVQDSQGRQLLFQSTQPATQSAVQAQNWAQSATQSAVQAQNWAQYTGGDVPGAPAGSRSAKSWSQDNLAGATYGGSAKDWSQSATSPDGTTSKSAKSYATDAQSSANAAFASAHIYANPSGGVDPTNGVPSGQLFLVSTADPYTFTQYLNNAGTAQLQGTVYMPDGTHYTKNASGALHELQSLNFTYSAGLPDGTTIGFMRPKTLDAPAASTVGGKSVSRLVQEDPQTVARRELAYYIDKALAHTESTYPITNTAIMSNAIDGTAFLQNRMAGSQMCADGQTVLVWQFTSETSTDDFGMGSLLLKRLTWNKTTRAWVVGSRVSVADTGFFEHSTVDPDGGTTQGRWISLSSVLLTSGAHKNRVLVIFCWENTTGTVTRVFTRYSDDNGATWSARSEITSQFPMTTGETWTILAPGPAPGLQMVKGTNPGRIVFPCWHGNPSYPNTNNNFEQFPENYRSILIYSDDNGVTWNVGVRAPREQIVDSNENAIAEDWAGDLLWAIRTPTFANSKCLFKVKNGGTTLATDAFTMVDGNGAAITTTQVMCGMRQAVADIPLRSSAPKIIASFPNDTARDKLTVFVSYDGGLTFPVSLLLVLGSSSYSSPVVLDGRTIGVFWEDASYTQLTMSVFNLTTLLGV